MNFGLTDEQQMIVATVRSFVEKELYPHEAMVEREGAVPRELGLEIARKCRDIGFFAANLPVEVGGGGLNHLDFTLLERELGRASMALTVFFGRPSGILMACEGEQRERYLLPAARGEKFDALAMSEPDAGSDVRGMKCSARPDGSDWVLNGSKHFISHADIADFVIVFAASGEEQTAAGPKKKITCFLVDRGTPGFGIRKGYNSVSHRGYHNCILTFDNCRLPAGQVLGEPHKGFELANEWLYATRLTVAAMAVGRARRAFDYAVAYAAERKQFGQPIASFQLVQAMIADSKTESLAARAMVLEAARQRDAGQPIVLEAAAAKYFASEMVGRVADRAVQIFGGAGYVADHGIERLYRDVRIFRIYEGTSQVQQLVIARETMKRGG